MKCSRNYVKMQISVIFVKKNLKINIWKIKNMVKLDIIVIIQGNIEMLHIAYIIWNILYLKKSPIAFHNGSNYDYDFTIKWLTDKFKTLRRKHWKIHKLYSFNRKKLQQLKKMEKKLQKTYLTYFNLLIAEVYGKLIIKSCQ